MAYPMLENALGEYYYFDGRMISAQSDEAKELLLPTDAVTYYETVRVKDSVLLYIEDHLNRLMRSVKGIEAFEVDTDVILEKCIFFIKNCAYDTSSANLRIVLTKDHLLLHICEANIPPVELKAEGIVTNILNWERVDPNIKVFRGDYKKAVAERFDSVGLYGKPYEVLLTDRNNKLYEGSKSNLFVIIDDEVYSAPDSKILIGITRRRVLDSLQASGANLNIGTYSLEELTALKSKHNVALFVSSTPFDILPVRFVEETEFDSGNNSMLKKIAASYQKATDEYISKAKSKYGI